MLAAMRSRDVLRRKCGCGGSGACSCSAPHSVASVVRQGLSTTSQPLDASLRRQMEGTFGQPFDGVRVHTDANAAASARAVDARAYTVGRHIVFDRDAYAPHSSEGKKLLAHELTHVVQQAGSEVIPTRLGSEHDEAERVADRAAEGVAIQRDEEPALRRTPAKQVSCAKFAPLKVPGMKPIEDPVAEITTAETEAQTYFDKSIEALEAAIATEKGKAKPAPNAVVAGALPYVGLDPLKASTWQGTDQEPGAAALLVKRLKLVRRIVGAGTIYYVCWWEGCDPKDVWGYGLSNYVMRLCPEYWNSELPVRALTIAHESFHIFFQWVRHNAKEVRESNAHCYERLVLLLAGVDKKHITDTCDEL